MKKKILTLAAVVTLPFILLVMYLLASMASYSNTYDERFSDFSFSEFVEPAARFSKFSIFWSAIITPIHIISLIYSFD